VTKASQDRETSTVAAPAPLENELADRLAAVLSGPLPGAVTIADVAPLPGHAGLGFSFVASAADGSRKLVVRTIAAGAPSTGPSDVIRQARIMESLRSTGVPVPLILAFGDADSAFGRHFFIAEFVSGTGLPGRRQDQTPTHAALARQGIVTMARLHNVPWQNLTAIWGPAQGLRHEFERLHRLVDRPTIDQAWTGRITLLGERLVATAPDRFETGCVHGDMHFGNMIFGPKDVRAVLDWEIAFIGSTLLDLGTMTFYADPAAALPEHLPRAERWVISPAEMIDTYLAAAGRKIAAADIAWHRAMAGYRFAAITLFNEMLHRRGKKHDPMWADVVRSVPTMVERSLEVLDIARS
jgi:aminoglycoside phosphotransferase (APT) family kinase protein